MKKTLVAMAALAATSAFAQNAVSLYGTLDMGANNIVYSKDGVTQLTRSGVVMSNHDSSRWGLTGKEDLGGGLAAEFKIESGIGTNPRSGLGGGFVPGASAGNTTASNSSLAGTGYGLDATVLGNREMWVGLTQGNVRVNAGYGVTAMRNLAVQTDAAGSNNFGNFIAHDVGGYRREGVRVDYTSGAVLVSGGVSGNRQNQTTGVNPAGEIQTGRGWTLGGQYTQGPINAGYFHDEATSQNPQLESTVSYGLGYLRNSSAAFKNATLKTDLLAGSYNAGVATVYGQYYTQKAVINETAAGVAGTDTTAGAGKLQGTSFGARVPFGAATVFAQAFNGKDKQYVGAGAEDRKFTGKTMGVTYALSKRTSTYLITGNLKKATNVSGTAAGDLEYKQTSAGIVHNF